MTTQTKIKVDSKVKNQTAKQVEFFNQFAVAFFEWKESKGGLLPSIMEDVIGNKVDRATKDKFLPDAKRQMDMENINLEGGLKNAVFNLPSILITKPEPDQNSDQESNFFWYMKQGKKMVPQNERYEKLFNSDRVETFLHNVKIEIQPLFNENRNEGDLAHYRANDNAIQIKERFLQPDNWYSQGLQIFVHEMVHFVCEYAKISNCSAKQQHNRSFQAMAMHFNLRTEWYKELKSCYTYELDEEFYAWFEKAFDVEHLKKNVFNIKSKQRDRSERKRTRAYLNGVPVWIPTTRYEQALCQNDCCEIIRDDVEH